MPLNNALAFIDRVRRDPAFRKSGYVADSPESFIRWTASEGYPFSYAEIDDAFRSLLLKAKDEECAEEIKELKNWYTLLARPPESTKACSTCGFKSNCGGSCPG